MTDTTFRRFFTLEEANALLPRLRPLVGRLQDHVVQIREAVSNIQEETGLDAEDPALHQEIERREGVADMVAGAQRLVDEIHRQGAVVNGPEEGLLDFPAMLDGEIVFLCWRSGEPRVGHWHRIPDGFAGRRPLLDDEEPGQDAPVH